MDRLKCGGFNLRVQRDPMIVRNEVATILRVHDLDVLFVSEAHQYVRALDSIVGYRLVKKGGWPQANECMALVRNGIPVTQVWNRAVGDGWFGARLGKKRPGRSFLRFTVDGWLRCCSLHMPAGMTLHPNGEVTPPARGEDYLALAKAVQRFFRWRSPRVVYADWNVRNDNTTPWSPRSIARRRGARAYAPDRRIDYLLAKNVAVANVRKSNAVRERSDHTLVLFTLLRIPPRRWKRR